MSVADHPGRSRLPHGAVSAICLAACFVALGGLVVWEARSIGAEMTAYARVGPQVFPWIVGVGLVIIGLLLMLQALRGKWVVQWTDAHESDGEVSAVGLVGRVGLVVLGLVVGLSLMSPAGFVPAATILFVLTARAFGSRRLLMDIVVAFSFAGFIFVAFAYGLGIHLPAGTLWGFR